MSVPTFREALTEAWVQKRTALLELKRGATGLIDGLTDIEEYSELSRAARNAQRQIDALLEASAAHALQWCHDMSTCPACKGEVTL